MGERLIGVDRDQSSWYCPDGLIYVVTDDEVKSLEDGSKTPFQLRLPDARMLDLHDLFRDIVHTYPAHDKLPEVLRKCIPEQVYAHMQRRYSDEETPQSEYPEPASCLTDPDREMREIEPDNPQWALIHPEALNQMRGAGGNWAAYQNVDLSSSNIGHLKFLKWGDGCTFLVPPTPHYPAPTIAEGHNYWFVGYVDLTTGDIRESFDG